MRRAMWPEPTIPPSISGPHRPHSSGLDPIGSLSSDPHRTELEQHQHTEQECEAFLLTMPKLFKNYCPNSREIQKTMKSQNAERGPGRALGPTMREGRMAEAAMGSVLAIRGYRSTQ